jgi:hypothetical protein
MTVRKSHRGSIPRCDLCGDQIDTALIFARADFVNVRLLQTASARCYVSHLTPVTGERFEAIKVKLDKLEKRAEKRQMIEGLRYGFNLALEASKYGKGPLFKRPIVSQFLGWLNAEQDRATS